MCACAVVSPLRRNVRVSRRLSLRCGRRLTAAAAAAAEAESQWPSATMRGGRGRCASSDDTPCVRMRFGRARGKGREGAHSEAGEAAAKRDAAAIFLPPTQHRKQRKKNNDRGSGGMKRGKGTIERTREGRSLLPEGEQSGRGRGRMRKEAAAEERGPHTG
jgi:hypothetical protein